MTKSYIAILCLLLCLPIVDAAHYFNQLKRESGYHTDGHFQLIYVKADRCKGFFLEKEDRFWIEFRFTVDVTRVIIRVKALDGTNDADSRKYTFKYSTMTKNRLKEMYCGNLPTNVDNLVITVEYYIGEMKHTRTIYIYSLTPDNKGTGIFAVSSDAIPDEYVRESDKGRWDSDDGIGQIGSPLLKMVSAPYNLLKWITDVNVLIALGAGIVTIQIGMIGLSYTKKFGFIVLIIVGSMVVAGVILEGFSCIM